MMANTVAIKEVVNACFVDSLVGDPSEPVEKSHTQTEPQTETPTPTHIFFFPM